MQRPESRLAKLAHLKRRRMTFKKRAEPRPRRRSKYAQRDRKERQNRERHRHHARALVRMPMAAILAEEHVADLARHVERRQQRAEHQQVKRPAARRANAAPTSRIASLLQKPEKSSGNPHSASMPMA